MKYSEKFERDWNWYNKYKDVFNFDGVQHYYNKKGDSIIINKEDGFTAKECFYKYDSEGKILPCKEPNLLYQVLKCKGSINLHIKMWSEDRANLLLFKCDLDELSEQYELLDWQLLAIENQTNRILKLKLNN
jgi:hypothetical protein